MTSRVAETLFQLAHLYMSDPQADRVQADKALDQLAPYAADPASVPQLAMQLALDRARYGDDPWYRAIPTEAELADFDLDRALAIYRDRFVDAGDFVYVVVGDVGAAEVRDLAGRYLGTLPTARTMEDFVDRRPDPPGGVVDERVEAGTGDQGSVLLAYAAPYVVDEQDDLGLQVLELILDGRLRDRLREQLGATYSPSVTIQAVDRPDRIIDSQILIGNDPARVDEIGTEARQVVDDLVSTGPTADEFATAVEQVRRRIELFSNPSLASAILSTALQGDGLDDYLRRDQLLADLTIGDVERLATVAFPPRRYVEIRQVPEGF